MSEWIRVEDRMPPDGEWVIVAAKDSAGKKFVECDIRWCSEDQEWQYFDGSDGWVGSFHDEVTHWMPIPEPPEESK